MTNNEKILKRALEMAMGKIPCANCPLLEKRGKTNCVPNTPSCDGELELWFIAEATIQINYGKDKEAK